MTSQSHSCCSSSPTPQAEQTIDPVCGMTVSTQSPHTFEHEGRAYYFCSGGCRTSFASDPAKYLQSSQTARGHTHHHSEHHKAHASEASGTYTCPMHPEVRQQGPGSCPICGMALEPLQVSMEEQPNAELADMTRRFVVAALLSVPLLIIAMAPMIPGFAHMFDFAWRPWIELLLATPVCTWAAWPFYERGAASLRSGHLNMFTLIALGVGVGFGYSVFATVFPGWLPASAHNDHGGVDVYFEAAATIVTLILLGQILELRARGRTSAAIRELMKLAPAMARRIDDHGHEHDVPLEHVHVGDRLRVRPGEKIPVDGRVL